MLINFIVGLVLMLVSLILDTAFNSTPSIADTNKVLKWFYRFSPGFCLGNGLLDMAFSSAGISFGQGSSPTLLVGPTNPIDWSHSGRDIFFLFFSAPIFLGLVVLVDVAGTYPTLAAIFKRDPKITDAAVEDEDEDVVAEAARLEQVTSGAAASDAIALVNLRKVYGSGCLESTRAKVAVKSLSFGVHKGECFGFLVSPTPLKYA